LLKNNLLSNSIMYKTWSSNQNRCEILKIIESLKKYKNIFSEIILENSTLAIRVVEEIKLLDSLCEHECIKEEIKSKLVGLFKQISC
jgi:hypothetical protein